MTKLAEQFKQGADQAWESMAEGWRELSARANNALTRFRPSPAGKASEENPSRLREEDSPSLGGWAFMASDVLDKADTVVVRIEAPGMRREDFNIELRGDILTVSGEKRSDRKTEQGRYSVVQCVYGSFKRYVTLPAQVKAEAATANYRDGVLRIELPKVESARARRIAIRGD